MVKSKAAKRYAKALFSLSIEQQQLEEIRGDMQDLAGLAGDSQDFFRFIRNPVIPGDRRRSVLHEIFHEKVRPGTYKFLLLLDDKRRLNELPDVCEVFEELYYEREGILKVHVTSATPLSAGQSTALQDRLKVKFSKEIELTTEEDPSQMGGLRIQAGDQIFDSSIAAQLEIAKTRLMHA